MESSLAFTPDFSKSGGLIAAVAQDAETLDVLMLAWMNPEAWEKTLETGEAHYYSRSRKPEAEAAGMSYKPLDALLKDSQVVFTCLNKNVLLLGQPEFEQLGAGKVLFNTSIGPGFDSAALERWLDQPGTHFFCDTRAAAGAVAEGFFDRDNVHCQNVSAGRTKQAFVLLSQKVLANIRTALAELE